MKGYPDALDKQLKEMSRLNSTLVVQFKYGNSNEKLSIRTEATVGTA